MIRFLINTPQTLRDNLREAAKPRGQTLNGLIRQILWEWVEREQNKSRPNRTAGR